ncbi:MAG: CysB family HTH-type transcriptional regulator [Neisseria sp.]|nr:CysB family HTH-type transcriptional regulator [Neisseria sp.]
MKLQQLRYALEVYRHNLNVSDAAEALFTSQPGVSKQIRLLEEELGIQIFIRSGKRIVSVSQPGKAVLEMSERILHDIQNIKNIGKEFTGQDNGLLTIATTHTQARYALPDVIARFVQQYPKVRLRIRQGNPEEIAQMVADGEADFAIATETVNLESDLRSIRCASWNHGVVVPENHPLLALDDLSLNDIAQYPLITYEFAFNSGSSIARAFHRAGISEPNIALSAADTGILKTYVKLGLGIGLIAQMAFDEGYDDGLRLIDTSHLFDPSHTSILLRADTYLRGYIYDFIKLFNPELDKERIDRLLYEPFVEDYSI